MKRVMSQEGLSIIFGEGYEEAEKFMQAASDRGSPNCGNPSEYGFCSVCQKQLIRDLSGTVIDNGMRKFVLVCGECAEEFVSPNREPLSSVAYKVFGLSNRPHRLEYDGCDD